MMKILLQFISTKELIHRSHIYYYTLSHTSPSNLVRKSGHTGNFDSLAHKGIKLRFVASNTVEKCRSRRTLSVKVGTENKDEAAASLDSQIGSRNMNSEKLSENGVSHDDIIQNLRRNINKPSLPLIQKNIERKEQKIATKVPIIKTGNSEFYEIRKMIHNLQTICHQNRNFDEIKSICNNLCEIEMDLSFKDSTFILYNLSVFNIPHEKLIMVLMKSLNAKLGEVFKAKPLLTGALRSMNSLLVRDEQFLNAVIAWFLEKKNSEEFSHAQAAVVSLAVLNYLPNAGEVLIKEILANSDPLQRTSTENYLHLVWALVILDRAESQFVESVMSYNFRRRLESILPRARRSSIYLKLNNIHAFAVRRKISLMEESSMYSGNNPWLNQIKETRQRNPVIKSVLDAMINLLPLSTFKTLVEFECGCVVDAICFFDKNGKSITETQFLSTQGVKVAIMVLDFGDLCLPNKTIHTGIIEFHKYYLENLGYRVLLINYSEFPIRRSLKEKMDYLESRFMSLTSQRRNS